MEDNGMLGIILPYSENRELQQLEIFDSSLTAVYSRWVKEFIIEIPLSAGVYAVKLTYLDGTSEQKIFKMTEGSKVHLRFVRSVRDDYVNTEFEDAVNYDHGLYLRDLRSSDGYNGGKTPGSENIFQVIGNRKKFKNHFRINTIDKENPAIRYYYEKNVFLLNLPINQDVECKVYKNKGPAGFVHELLFELNLSNKEADAILKFMTSGDIDRAKTLAEHIRFAEQLLYDKLENPSFAALGGYFLLRTNKLEYLHHWPRNLYQWFKWLPDGCIIYAVQMMRTNVLSIQEMESLYMEAYNRGVPLYTEGLRLMYEGLMRLHYLKEGRDTRISNAFEEVQQWMSYCSQDSGFTVLRFPDTEKNELFTLKN